MATPKIVLFDLPSREPAHAWSWNTWKTRLFLNYKGLDYETEWLEYPEIKPRLQPHLPDNKAFTVPAIKLPDGTYIMDSWVIAQELDRRCPSPNLPLDSPPQQKYIDLLDPTVTALRPEIVQYVPSRLLNEVNLDFWDVTRSARYGMPLEQFVRENGGEKAYKVASPYLQEMTAMLKENKKGVFFMGDTISYVDFVHAGFLIMFRRLGSDVFQQLLQATGEPDVHLKFLEALKPWIEKDN